VETGCQGGQGSPTAVVVRAVQTGCQGGQGSLRAVAPRAVETGCRGGQGSPRAVAPSEEEEKNDNTDYQNGKRAKSISEGYVMH
jgi:hypothetical protein